MRILTLTLAAIVSTVCVAAAAEPAGLTIAWEANYLTIRGDFPGGELKTHYLSVLPAWFDQSGLAHANSHSPQGREIGGNDRRQAHSSA